MTSDAFSSLAPPYNLARTVVKHEERAFWLESWWGLERLKEEGGHKKLKPKRIGLFSVLFEPFRWRLVRKVQLSVLDISGCQR